MWEPWVFDCETFEVNQTLKHYSNDMIELFKHKHILQKSPEIGEQISYTLINLCETEWS